MKRIYSIVLMATALFIGTNAWADASVSSWAELKTELQKGGTVTLSADIESTDLTAANCIWIGTENEGDDDAPEAVLNLNGHNITIKSAAAAINPFVLSKGSLKITSSSPATIEVKSGTQTTGASTNVISVFGSSETYAVNPQEETPFSYLEIDENVTILTENGTVIAVDQLTLSKQGVPSHAAVKSLTTKPNYTTNGMACGARVDVKGSLISQGAKQADNKNNKCYGIKVNGLVKDPSDKSTATYVHIYPSAVIIADNRSDIAGAAAVYASGYAQWLIEGNCSGATGVYVSAGVVNVKDANVKSAADNYNVPDSGGHANGSGSAIVINSRSGYVGEVELTVSGDTKVEATSGYAMEEVVNTKTNPETGEKETKVEQVTIEGGTFEGGDKGAITIAPTTAEEAIVTVGGGNVSGSAEIGEEDLATYLNEQGGTHTTLVTDEITGKTILVISEGNPPSGQATVSGQTGSVKWEGATETDKIAKNTTLTLDELQINDTLTDGSPRTQVLTIEEGATLEVARVILGKKAQIIVEPGAKFIVTGKQGIVAPSVDNIVLKTSESAQAIFLFNPSVSSNRHPNATVELLSKSYYEGGKTVYQRFGIPTYDNNVKIEYKNTASSVTTYIVNWDYAADAWSSTGWTAVPAATGLTIGVSGPFGCFELVSNNAKAAPMSYLFKGALVGNDDAAMEFNSGFNPYANSYMAPMDIATFLNRLDDNYPEMEASIYVYQSLANDNYMWRGLGQADFTGWDTPDMTEVAPMQAYMLNLKSGSTSNTTVSYKDNVYDPYIAKSSSAPARNKVAAKKNFLKLTIANEEGIVFDNARILEDNQFSDEFDNGYDITKFMNEKVSLYVSSQDEAWSTLATDNVLNTYIGVNVAQSGVYTISVAHNGLDYALVDLENNKVINLENGNSYNFYQEAGKNDARFQVVKINKVPTAIDNVQNNVLSTKVMKDGVLYILKNGAVYNAQGQIVK